MTRKLFVFAILIVVVASLAGCDAKNPVGPSPIPTTCEDAKAFNNGGPLPCRYTFVSIDGITPASGSTINYNDEVSTKPRVSVNYSYEFDPKIPGTVGLQVFLSVDCVNVVGNENLAIFSRTSGMFSGTPSLPRWSGIKQTNCVIVRMVRVNSNRDVVGIITEAIKPWIFNFE